MRHIQEILFTNNGYQFMPDEGRDVCWSWKIRTMDEDGKIEYFGKPCTQDGLEVAAKECDDWIREFWDMHQFTKE